MSDTRDPKRRAQDAETDPGHESRDSKQKAREAEVDTGMDRRSLLRGSVVGLTALGVGSAGGKALAATGSEPLVLKHEDLRGSVAGLFGELNGSQRLQKIFINDPSRVVLSAILPKGAGMPSDQRLSEANRFLFSLLANGDFRDWAREYQEKLNEGLRSGALNPKDIDKGTLAQDLVEAFGRYGDPSLITALGNQAMLPDKDELEQHGVEVAISIYILVVSVIVLVIVAIDLTPLTSDEYADKRLSPAEIRSLADQLVNQAKRRQQAGSLADPRATH